MDKIIKTNLITGEVEEIEQEIIENIVPIENSEQPKTDIEILQEQVRALTLALLEV